MTEQQEKLEELHKLLHKDTPTGAVIAPLDVLLDLQNHRIGELEKEVANLKEKVQRLEAKVERRVR